MIIWYILYRLDSGLFLGDFMKKLESLLFHTTAYTVLILLMFYIFGVASDFTDAYISFPTFMTILGFGALISLASMIFSIKKIHMALRTLIHFVVLLIAFCVIFISAGNISSGGQGAIFIAIAIFTVFYLSIFAISFIIISTVRKADANIDKKIKAETQKLQKKKKYKPLYKSGE